MSRLPDLPVPAVSFALIVLVSGLASIGGTFHGGASSSAPLLPSQNESARASPPHPGLLDGLTSRGLPAPLLTPTLSIPECRLLCHFESGVTPTQVNASSEGWAQLHPDHSPPVNASEYDHAVYDPADDATVLLQSSYACGACKAPSTWVFHSGNWSLDQSSPPPGPRALPTLVYDAGDGYVMLYGGQTWNSTWKFSGGNWTNITHGAAPNPMEGVAMAYDSLDKYVLLFGGINTTGSGIPNETWAFAGGNWTRIGTQGQAPPDYGDYYTNPMVYDAALDSVLLFENTNWTYLYQAGTWQAVYAPIPLSLEAAGGTLTYDALSGEAIYQGGYEGGIDTNQTWAFNGTRWTPLHSFEAPPAALYPALVPDSGDSAVLFFGGGSYGGGGNNQTWIFGAGNVSFVAVPGDGGNFSVGGISYPGGRSSWVPFGIYKPKLLPSPGFHGHNISVSGNFTPYNGSYRLTGNATVVGRFVAFPRVSLATLPANCEVNFNNTLYPSGSSAPFVPGSYSLIAPDCPHLVFKNWLLGENASVLNVYDNRTTVTLSGPSTLTAEFLATVTFEVNPSFSGTIFVATQLSGAPEGTPKAG